MTEGSSEPCPPAIAGIACVADTLIWRARNQPDRLAFKELRNDLSERDGVTYAELDARASKIAAELRTRLDSGARVLIVSPRAIDHLASVLGCFYAGAVAVSGMPPYAPSMRTARHSARVSRLRDLLETSDARAILGPPELIHRVEAVLAPAIRGIDYIDYDAVQRSPSRDRRPVDPAGSELALIQYTSGSTSAPGGVVLSHRNLISNLEAQRVAFELREVDIGVSWLPLYHDLGLIGAGLLPIYCGFPCILMPAAGFLEEPDRWLTCISRERASITWAPNFAYSLAAEAVTEAQRATLDLSCWRIAMNAAEPVRAETVRHFTKTFADCGFRANAMYPAYGLAEATLAVTAPTPGADVRVLSLDKAALAHARVRPACGPGADVAELVACGHPVPDVQVAIVDPCTDRLSGDDEVGEIWVAGPGCSEGYCGASSGRDAFVAQLDGSDRRWLRTGDLGFMDGGDLFIAGRLKDLIILRGANIYPQDLEATAAASHPALKRDCACAFPIQVGGEEAIALVCEIDRRREHDAAQAAASIRRAVFREHGLETHLVVVTRFGAVPKTPSGKLQRKLCRDQLMAEQLPVLRRDELTIPGRSRGPTVAPADPLKWVLSRLEQASGLENLAPQSFLAELGLSSLQITELAAEIETAFDRRIPVAELYELQRVADVAELLRPINA